MKKQLALLIVILFVSAAYAMYAAKRFGIWGLLLYISIWAAVFLWARSRKKA